VKIAPCFGGLTRGNEPVDAPEEDFRPAEDRRQRVIDFVPRPGREFGERPQLRRFEFAVGGWSAVHSNGAAI
jgi:hypothetical protein